MAGQHSSVRGFALPGRPSHPDNSGSALATDASSGIAHLASPPQAIHYFLLAAGFTTFAIYGSLIPFKYTPLSWAEAGQRFLQLPFFNLGFKSPADWLQNILLFVPIGFFTLAALTVDNSSRPWKAVCVSIVLLACALLSASLEFAQFWFPPRIVSQNDIVAETIGSMLGTSLWLGFGPALTALLRKVTAIPRPKQKFDWLLHAYCVGLFSHSVMPLDVTIRSIDLWRKYFDGRLQLVPFTNIGVWHDFVYHLLANAAIFAPVGVLVATTLTPSRQAVRSIGRCVGIGLLIATGIELCQVFVYSRYVDTSDLFSGTLGIGLGAWGIRAWGPLVAASLRDAATGRYDVTWSARALLLGGSVAVTIAVGFLWLADVFPSSTPLVRLPLPSRIDLEHHFVRTPDNPFDAPHFKPIPLPGFRGGYAIWGATGRDSFGHIWFAVSSSGVSIPSAHLYQFDPASGAVLDRGDVVSQLRRNFICRRGEGQMKIQSKIVQAVDGYLYFASLDEQGEHADGTRLSDWGSHLWRVDPLGSQWEHLFSAPEGLLAAATGERYVYALGYFDHVLYQFDCATGTHRSVHVGSVGGHISRNFICDHRGHAYVPRLRSTDKTPGVRVTLVEFNPAFVQVAETPLEYYMPPGDVLSHGIVAFQPLADRSIVFATHIGYLYQIVPGENGPAEVRALGWFHPQVEAYVPSMFTYGGERYLLGAAQGQPFEWLIYDLSTRRSVAVPLPETKGMENLLLYGSVTCDNRGNFYLVGTHRESDRASPQHAEDEQYAERPPQSLPIILQVQPPL